MILIDPDAILERALPESKIKRLINRRSLTVRRAALAQVDGLPIDRSRVVDTALKVLKGYKDRIDEGLATKTDLLADPKQLIQRVRNEVVLQITERVKEKYSGERYRWLPSDAQEPDPEHQLNYGKVFTVGEGEMPGERIGCRCGMEILVDDDELEL